MKAPALLGSILIFAIWIESLFAQEFYDTTCSERRFTRAGFKEFQPIKGRSLGHFNCSGLLSLYDPVSGNITATIPIEATLSSLYNKTCGCVITETQSAFGSSVIFEYAVEPGVSCLVGNVDPLGDPLYGQSLDTPFGWREITYVEPANRKIAALQILKPLAEKDELVEFLTYDTDSGRTTSIFNLVCEFVSE